MAIQDAQPGLSPVEAARRRRRLRRMLAVAAVAAIGLAVGLVVWAPWDQGPIPPAAVRAESPTATSVLVSWTPAKGGAAVSRFLILRDGTQVGSVPAGQTAFTDHGVAPGTRHRYSIITLSGTRRSAPSVKAAVTTLVPTPVGLTAAQPTWTTVTLRWSPSPKGPAPDQYVLLSGQASVAVLPGTADSYQVSGLAPGSTHQYQVAARWGDHESAPSPVLQTATLAPPLQGDVSIEVKTVSTPGAGASLKVGQKWSDSWTFTPECTADKCTLTTAAEFAAPGFTVHSFTVTMASSGAGYSGTAQARITKCQSTGVKNTVDVRITANKVDDGAWDSWSGTMRLSSPYVSVGGGYFCPAQSWNFSIAGTAS